ncbi:ATP-dependent endonuclease [Streptomyces sp. NPDC058440]|uniref:ATP-dependent nuclease n=1 Tax=Streptomyces sp. NPDC058440 TaxID=3346501 RepID=UPI00365C0920
MRLSRLSASNFRGVREFSVEGLDASPLTVLTGQNGAGKSTVLSIIGYLVGRSIGKPATAVGPNGSSAFCEASFILNDREFEALDDECRERFGRPAIREAEYTHRVIIHENGKQERFKPDELQIAFSLEFQARFPFSTVTQVGPSESFKLQLSPTISLGMPFNPHTTIKSHSGFNNPTADTEGYLASLDYQTLLAQRDGRSDRDGFAEISEKFQEMTDRILLRPSSNRAAGSTHLLVALPNGRHHGLDGLSSGERGALGLLCLSHYIKSAGGIVLLDEPELHLHRSVHVPILNTFRDLPASAQVVMATHSEEIVAAAPANSVIEVSRNSASGNQARRPIGARGTSNPVGRDAATAMLAEFQLIVEGTYDDDDLRALFPDEIGRAKVVKADGSSGVMSHYRVLEANPGQLPWLCLRDRDLLTAEDMETHRVRYPNLHIWPLRAIESTVLHPPLISAVFTDNGRSLSEAYVEELLRESSAHLMAEAVKTLAHIEINRLHPQPKQKDYDSESDFYLASAEVDRNRAESWDEILSAQSAAVQARWKDDWLLLADPKVLIRIFHSKVKLFAKHQDLKAALMTRAGKDADVRPPALEDFRVRMARLRTQVAEPNSAWRA